ncbi:MAG: helix-turn-helix domain-containing protein, partial [Eubacterium sp.]
KTITMKEDQYYRFMEVLGEYVGSGDGMIQISTADGIETFSPPIFAAWCSRNGEACIRRLAAYKKLIGPLRWVVSADEEELTVTAETGDPELHIPSFLAQSDFVFLTSMIRRAVKEEISPVRITLEKAPEGRALADFAKCEVKAGPVNSITFRKEDMEKPFVSFNPAMWDYFEPEMNRRLSDLAVDDSTSARVRSALSELLPGGACGIEDVAEKLGLSRRTLQRKLKEENTTFQKQLNSSRESLAIHYIRNTDMSTADIAFLLGYAELNSFLRAFSVWTGKSVTEYRKTLD